MRGRNSLSIAPEIINIVPFLKSGTGFFVKNIPPPSFYRFKNDKKGKAGKIFCSGRPYPFFLDLFCQIPITVKNPTARSGRAGSGGAWVARLSDGRNSTFTVA